MPDRKISQFPAITVTKNTDEFVINDPTDNSQAPTGTNKKYTADDIADAAKKFAALTTGSIPFAGASGEITEDNSNLFWDDTEDQLKIKTDFEVSGTFGAGHTLGAPGAGTRMLFNSRTASFRAGNVTGTQWDVSNIGNYSCAFGLNNTASGSRSFASGQGNIASGADSVAFGLQNTANGSNSIALGEKAVVNANDTVIWNATGSTETTTKANSFILMPGSGGSVSISNVSPDTTAILQIDSTTQGFLAPRQTTGQRNAIVSPAEGLSIFDITVSRPSYRDSTAWHYLARSVDTTQANTASGIWAVPQNITLDFHMIDERTVILTYTGISAAATTSAIITFDTAIPIQYRPTTNIEEIVIVTDNNQVALGLLKITTGGVVTIGVTPANSAFSGISTSGNSGINFKTIQYNLTL